MAKKIKFSLILKNNVQVRNLEELKENFDFEKIYEYFLNGKLAIWLEDRYYEEEAQKLSELKDEDIDFQKQIYEIFDMPFNEEEQIDIKNKKREQKKLEKIKAYTGDEYILNHLELVAMNQEELADLLDKDTKNIYLFNGIYKVPVSKKGVSYQGIGNVTVQISCKTDIDLSDYDISLKNITLFCKENITIKMPSFEKVHTEGEANYKVGNTIEPCEVFLKIMADGTGDYNQNAVPEVKRKYEGLGKIGLFSKNIVSGKINLIDIFEEGATPLQTHSIMNKITEEEILALLKKGIKDTEDKVYYVKQMQSNGKRIDSIICYRKNLEEKGILIENANLRQYLCKIKNVNPNNCEIVISLDNFYVIDGKIVFKIGYALRGADKTYEMAIMVSDEDGRIENCLFIGKEDNGYVLGGAQNSQSINNYIVYCDSEVIIYLIRNRINYDLYRYDIKFPEAGARLLDKGIKFNYQCFSNDENLNTYVVMDDSIFYIKSEDKELIVTDHGPFQVIQYNMRTEEHSLKKRVINDSFLVAYRLYKMDNHIYFGDMSIYNELYKQYGTEDALYDEMII